MKPNNDRKENEVQSCKRKLKIQPFVRLNRYSNKTVPTITLCGNWLEACGFDYGKNVIIEVAKGIIILKVDNN
jgi:hypothetical protein